MEPSISELLKEQYSRLDILLSTLMEDAAMIGGAKLFDDVLWDKVKEDLPDYKTYEINEGK